MQKPTEGDYTIDPTGPIYPDYIAGLCRRLAELESAMLEWRQSQQEILATMDLCIEPSASAMLRKYRAIQSLQKLADRIKEGKEAQNG
jgi:hypothetical protein